MYRSFLALSLLFATALPAQEIWTVQQPGEMTTADFYLLENGSRTTGLLIGKKNSGSNDELLCFVMVTGYQWNPCPPGFTSFAGMSGAFITGAKYGSPSTLYAIRTEIQGMSSVTALVRTDAFLNNMIVLKVFNNDTEEMNGSLAILGDTIWAGTNDGKVLRSTDGGTTFETFTVTTDTEVGITYLHFTDAQNGYAAGGATKEEDTGEGTITTVLSKGGIWTTTDGGASWTAVKEGLPYSFLKVAPVTTGGGGDLTNVTWYAFYTDDESYSGGDVSKHVGVTSDNFATLTIAEPQANTGKTFGGFQAAGVDIIDGTDIWLGGVCNDFKACSIVSFDGGTTWLEMFMPADVGVSFMWSLKAQNFLDSKHGWAAGSVNTILRWGDPNEDLTEQPDTETPDDTVSDDTTTDDAPVADNGLSDADEGGMTDDVQNDTGGSDDSDALYGEEEPACGCSLVF